MDRLTKRIDGGVDDFGMPLVSTYEIVDKTPGLANARVRCQLGRYEDTGLTPDEIAALRAELDAIKADIEAGRLVRFEDGEPYWYCPHCREEVGAYSVTYGELHDRCGHPVEWIKPVKRAAQEGGQNGSDQA